jgi:hypothetical protein
MAIQTAAGIARPRRRGRSTTFATALLATVLVAACGGGSSPVGSAAPGGASPAPAGGGGGGGGSAGEPYDKAKVEGAVAALSALESYLYEGKIVQTGGSGTRTQDVRGVVRTKPGPARSVAYTADGNTIVLMNVDGKDFADFGNGLAPATADQGTREESDPLALSALYAAFLSNSNDFVLAGKETVHEVASDHLVLDPDELAKVRDQFGDGNEAWVAELWLAEADGRLVKAVWGGPLAAAPESFAPPFYTIDVTDTNCTCPVTAPG